MRLFLALAAALVAAPCAAAQIHEHSPAGDHAIASGDGSGDGGAGQDEAGSGDDASDGSDIPTTGTPELPGLPSFDRHHWRLRPGDSGPPHLPPGR